MERGESGARPPAGAQAGPWLASGWSASRSFLCQWGAGGVAAADAAQQASPVEKHNLQLTSHQHRTQFMSFRESVHKPPESVNESTKSVCVRVRVRLVQSSFWFPNAQRAAEPARVHRDGLNAESG